MTIKIQLLEEPDLAAVDAMLMAAYQRPVGFERTLRLYRRMEPQGFWIASENGQIVGSVGSVNYGDVAYIGLMGVHPDAQRRQIGRCLLTRALESIDEQGCPVTLLDATDAGARLYVTMGFVDDAQAQVFERKSKATIVPCMDGIRPAADGDFQAITRFDARCFGACREKLFGPLWADGRDRCLVAHDANGNLCGYLFAGNPIFGPWAAEDPLVAEQLLVAGMVLPLDNPPVVLAPRSNARSTQLLTGLGFVQRRTLRHMRRGGTRSPGMPEKLFGQASFAHG